MFGNCGNGAEMIRKLFQNFFRDCLEKLENCRSDQEMIWELSRRGFDINDGHGQELTWKLFGNDLKSVEIVHN